MVAARSAVPWAYLLVGGRRWLGMLALVLLVTGCAATRVVGFVDPAYGGSRYDRFLVYAAFRNLGLEADYERAVCRALRHAGHACTTMLEVTPPTRRHTDAGRYAAAASSGAQAMIVVALADSDSLARRALSDGGPDYRVSVVDNQRQSIAARLAVHTAARAGRDTPVLASALADAVVRGLRRQHLLQTP